MNRRAERLLLTLILLATVAHRAHCLDQPITENYIGRQIPTAMVARNLELGSGFLAPELDTGPFPNRFLIEPPIYAQVVVAGKRLGLFPLEPSGRLVSAMGTAMAVWGLFGLARRRIGARAALASALALAMFPVTIRYGRAFQPDALMFGSLLAGLRILDGYKTESEEPRTRCLRLVLGAGLISVALALKIIWAVVAIPVIVLGIVRSRRTLPFVLICLLPALVWYVHAQSAIGGEAGSLAMSENFRIWSQVLIPTAAISSERLALLTRFLLVRSFTPIGIALGTVGLISLIRQEWSAGPAYEAADCPVAKSRWAGGCSAGTGRLWTVWLGSSVLFLGVFFEKLHHEYYLLVIAPLIAVGFGVVFAFLEALDGWYRVVSVTSLGTFVAFCLVGSASTFRTPDEWRDLSEASRWVDCRITPDSLVVAPEAMLYFAARRGCRLELTPRAAERAANEWGGSLSDAADRLPEGSDAAVALVEFYRGRGARYLADLGHHGAEPERLALHRALRNRYDVLEDRPEVFLVRLIPPTEVESAAPCPSPTSPSL